MHPPSNLAELSSETPGVLPDEFLVAAAATGWIDAGPGGLPPGNVQPASLDLRLGDYALRIRCSFLPDHDTVLDKVEDHILDRIDLRDGAILETNRPYLIPLVERLHLPPFLRGRANPKSSTGRLDVFTRVITDRSFRFDEVAEGYDGPLYLEVVPLSFAVRVRAGLALNQLRLLVGQSQLSDLELRELHRSTPLLYRGGQPVADSEFHTANGLFLSLDVQGGADERVGYRSRSHASLLDMSRGGHRVEDFWEPVRREKRNRVVLDPESFYLLLSAESVRVPPSLACEMTAYDPTSGELRTHYAGFFDPGFGYSRLGQLLGSRAALEVRAHDVPFMIEHGQRVCKLTYEAMVRPPARLYGEDVGSNYQGQVETLGKHFRPETLAAASGDKNTTGDNTAGAQEEQGKGS